MGGKYVDNGVEKPLDGNDDSALLTVVSVDGGQLFCQVVFRSNGVFVAITETITF